MHKKELNTSEVRVLLYSEGRELITSLIVCSIQLSYWSSTFPKKLGLYIPYIQDTWNKYDPKVSHGGASNILTIALTEPTRDISLLPGQEMNQDWENWKVGTKSCIQLQRILSMSALSRKINLSQVKTKTQKREGVIGNSYSLLLRLRLSRITIAYRWDAFPDRTLDSIYIELNTKKLCTFLFKYGGWHGV